MALTFEDWEEEHINKRIVEDVYLDLFQSAFKAGQESYKSKVKDALDYEERKIHIYFKDKTNLMAEGAKQVISNLRIKLGLEK